MPTVQQFLYLIWGLCRNNIRHFLTAVCTENLQWWKVLGSLVFLVLQQTPQSVKSFTFSYRSPGLVSPPLRNFTPTAAMQATDMTSTRHNNLHQTAHPAAHLLQHITSRNSHNAIAPASHDVPTSLPVHNTSPQEVRLCNRCCFQNYLLCVVCLFLCIDLFFICLAMIVFDFLVGLIT